MATLDQLIGTLRKTKANFIVAGPQDEEHVTTIEQSLGTQLPPSYRSFLLQFGAISNGNECISGIWEDPLRRCLGSTHCDTTRFREDYSLPQQFVVIQLDEEAPFCLDTAKKRPDGECPVVCYELMHAHSNRLAASFQDFIVEWLELRIKT